MNMVQGIIYDCDGVLFESREANLAYYNAVLQTLGAPPVNGADTAKVHICHTAASPEVFAALLGESRVAAAMEVANSLDYRHFIPAMIPEPELVATLATLSRVLPLAVATNRGRSIVDILDHFSLGGYFRAVVTSRDVARPKPAPDMLLLAAEQLQLAPRDLVFVGDSELDRLAAKAAGIRFVGYRSEGKGEKVQGHHELLDLLAVRDHGCRD